MNEKRLGREEVSGIEDGFNDSDRAGEDEFHSSDRDKREMTRMGKTQEMRRIFHQVSLLSYTTILMGTWQWMLMANSQGLTDGGRAGLFWTYIWTFLGYAFLAATLAEMASMAPTAGGQYHWVSELAPPKYQQVLSYASGWLSTLSWQAGNASGLFLAGVLIQILAKIRHPDYAAPAYQGWLLVVAVTAICVFFNIWAEPLLPYLQTAFLPVYVGTFIATVAVLWTIDSGVDARDALLELKDFGGWNSIGLALMVGQVGPIFALGGSDAAAHMSEEVHNAGLTVPRAMVWTILGNGTLGLVATVSFIFAVPNVHDALNHPSGFPIIYALDQVPGRGHTFTIALMALQLVILMVGNVGFQASVSRQTFAFARDRGLPFSNWIGHVNPKFHLPANAILLSATLSILVSLINLGSNTAFNAILSLGAVAAMGTFCISTTCLVYRRIYAPDSLPKSQWSLGKWGLPVNTVGALYSWFAFFWAFWPMSTPATVLNVNWAVVMFCGVVLLALVYYFWKARTTYKGPVTETEKWKEEHY